jgi:4-hydroxy-3-methylbut-2-enyl diphosphate reductase
MRFSAAVVFAMASTASAFQPIRLHNSMSGTRLGSTKESTTEKPTTKKEDRLRMMKSDRFHRRGFKDVREKVEESMLAFNSEIVKDLKEQNYLLEKDGVKVYLAKVRF